MTAKRRTSAVVCTLGRAGRQGVGAERDTAAARSRRRRFRRSRARAGRRRRRPRSGRARAAGPRRWPGRRPTGTRRCTPRVLAGSAGRRGGGAEHDGVVRGPVARCTAEIAEVSRRPARRLVRRAAERRPCRREASRSAGEGMRASASASSTSQSARAVAGGGRQAAPPVTPLVRSRPRQEQFQRRQVGHRTAGVRAASTPPECAWPPAGKRPSASSTPAASQAPGPSACCSVCLTPGPQKRK